MVLSDDAAVEDVEVAARVRYVKNGRWENFVLNPSECRPVFLDGSVRSKTDGANGVDRQPSTPRDPALLTGLVRRTAPGDRVSVKLECRSPGKAWHPVKGPSGEATVEVVFQDGRPPHRHFREYFDGGHDNLDVSMLDDKKKILSWAIRTPVPPAGAG